MSLLTPIGQDPQGLARQKFIGDVVLSQEFVPAANTSTALTYTGALLLQSIFLANPGGVATYTIDSAANILAAIAPQYAYNQNANLPAGTPVYQGIQPGTSWRIKIVNASANAIAVQATANTGVTVNRGSVAASVSRDFLVTVNSGGQAQTCNVATTNGSAVVTGFTTAQLAAMQVGMIVTNAVAGLQGTTILAINITTGSVTMSGNANATNANVSVNYSPTVTIDGL